MNSIHNINSSVGIQSLSERDFLDGLSYHLFHDETLTGVDTTWLDVAADVKHGSVGDLFPDLLDIEHDDDMSLRWLEDADVRQFLGHGVTDITSDLLQTTASSSPHNDGFTSDFLIHQLTPPESPHAQVAPEIYFVQEDIDTIMAKPLSPIDISRVLDAPTSVSESKQSIITTHQPQDTPTEHDQAIYHMIQDMESFISLGLPPPTDTNRVAMPIDDSFCDVSSPESDTKDRDYIPSFETKRKSKSKRTRKGKVVATPYSDERESKSSGQVVDVLTRTVNKIQRKKMQNKNAATKYRIKKRGEKDVLVSEEDGLQLRNTELRDKVEQLTREIGYMKDLMAEVTKARGKARLATRLVQE